MSAFLVERVPGDLDVVAVTDEGLGNTSWVLGLDGDVVVVDAERDPAPYLAVAEQLGGPVVLAADTHLHADFLTGTPELAARGARTVVPAAGQYEWGDQHVRPGERVDVGAWRLTVLPTPGHTPEHVAYVLGDGSGPRAVLTGGSLLVGAVARTDLTDPELTEALTRSLWRSIGRELLSLADDVLLLPTHGAGSFCTVNSGGQRWTTLGAERRSNPLLQVAGEDEFVATVLGGLGSFPPYFLRTRDLNRRGPRVVGEPPPLDRLSADDVVALRARGGTVVDTRAVPAYAAAHVPGSLANTLRPQFASWLGWLVDPAAPLAFVVDEHTDQRELVRQCHNVGYERLTGVLTLDVWRAAGRDVASISLVRAASVDGRRVVDVRQAAEFAAGHVPGATHVELGSVRDNARTLSAEPVLVMCGHGERAATAASLLEAAGAEDVAVLDGGPGDWAATDRHELAR